MGNRSRVVLDSLIVAAAFGSFGLSSVSAASVTSFGVDKNTINIEVTPSFSNSGASIDSHTATIKTDCGTGYKIYVSMANGKNQNLHLSGDTDNDEVGVNAIGPTSSSIANLSAGSATILGTNTWGIRLGSGTATSAFAAVPTYKTIATTDQSANPSSLISSSSAANTTSGDSYTITYGANVDSGINAGDYSSSILYTTIMDQACYTPVSSTVTVSKAADAASQAAFSAVSGSGEYNEGTEVTLGYTLNTGYHFDSWAAKDASNNNITVTDNKFTMPGSNVAATATGAINTTTISYNTNGATGSPSKTTETVTYGTNVTMPAIGTMVKDGYTFAGWSLSSDATTATWIAGQSSIDPTAIKTDLGSAHGGSVTVYAIWGENTSPVGQTMQGFDCAILPNENDEIELTDTRDGKKYTVKKLRNDTCWMTNNLALEDYTITSADSDVADGVSFDIPAATDDWVYVPPENSYQYPAKTIGDVNNTTTPFVYYNTEFESYVYNYITASAGKRWNVNVENSETFYSTQSICPKGWKLPSAWDFAMIENEGIYDDRYNFEPVNWSYGGNYSISEYWSSEGYVDDFAYYLLVTSSYIQYNDEPYPAEVYPPSQGTAIGFGMGVRCVARDNLHGSLKDMDGQYLQNLTPEIVSRTAVGETASMVDFRNNKTYTAKKLADGKIWLLSNLSLTYEWYGTAWGYQSNATSGQGVSLQSSDSGWGTGSDGNSEWDTNAYNTGDDNYGALYNYVAATNGSAWYGSNNTASGDICPTGWKLPTQGEFETLRATIGDSGIFSATGLNLIPAGLFEQTGSFGGGSGTNGKFWTSTLTTGSEKYSAQALSITNNQIDGFVAQNKSYGAAIRCVSK